MRDLSYLPPFRNGKLYRIGAIINGVERLVILLHYPDLAECAAAEARDCRTLDDVCALKMRYSELEFLRETETNVKIVNGTKGARAKYTRKELRKQAVNDG